MATSDLEAHPLRPRQRAVKRASDLLIAGMVIAATWWLVAIGWLGARLSTGESGFFTQDRIGRDGRSFRLIKLRTMRASGAGTTVTVAEDPRITNLGRFLRRTKIDELPQFANVLAGHMSVVGPRPDVPGYADRLGAEDRILLTVRPGITGPTTLRFRNEERLLADQDDPERFNDEVLWPAKVRLNRKYLEEYSLWRDFMYCLMTLPLPRGVRRRLEQRYLSDAGSG